MRTIPRATILDTLINTLEAERYMRGPLLVEVIAELRANERLAEAAELAGSLLASVETGLLRDDEFSGKLAQLRAVVRACFGEDPLPAPVRRRRREDA